MNGIHTARNKSLIITWREKDDAKNCLLPREVLGLAH